MGLILVIEKRQPQHNQDPLPVHAKAPSHGSTWRLAAIAVTTALALSSSAAAAQITRLIESASPPSTAELGRVVIDGDSRYVLGHAPTVLLHDAREVTLPSRGPAEFAVELPDTLPEGATLYVQGEIGIEDEGDHGVQKLRRTPLDPRIQDTTRPSPLTLRGEIPEADRGKPARLDISARIVAPSTDASILGPVDVRNETTRLEISYGVEPLGWIDEAPAVRFSLTTVADPEKPLWVRTIDPARDERDRRWHDASISLGSLTGTSPTLRLRAEAIDPTGERAAGALGVFANPRLQTTTSELPTKKNLIVISADTLRAQSVGAYGYTRPTSPNIDRYLGGGGVMVRDAIAPMPFTPASHMSMFTGLQPCIHNVMGITDALAPNIPTLAEWLRDDGYETAAFTENAFLVAGGGFDRGFDVYVENRSDESLAGGYARETFAQATSWLQRNRALPFFLFVHTYQVHSPYTPPRGFRAVLPDTDRWGDHARNHDAYDREIRYLDEILGSFFDELERLGLADDTVLMLTSDHGEGFGEHKRSVGHNYALWDEAIRVPMFVRAPGVLPAGTIAETQVGLVDVAPTVLDLLQVKIPEGLDGKSFAPALRGDAKSVEEFASRPVFSRGTPLSRHKTTGQHLSAQNSVRTKQWKFVAPRALFDLENDPGETRRVNRMNPEAAERLKETLMEHRRRCARHWNAASKEDAVVERAPAWISDMSRSQRKRLDETRRKLESLGYVE